MSNVDDVDHVDISQGAEEVATRSQCSGEPILEALQLKSILPRKEMETYLYIRNRAKLEQMYPYLPQGQKGRDTVAGVVYSTLKYTVSKEKDARAVREKCKQPPQHAHQSLCMCVHCIAHS